MKTSLTVILPIHNAESSLRRNVLAMLDVAADLTPRFELLVFDDGSTDDSYDVANELAAEYPQVRVGRHSRRRGLGPTLRNARRRAAGELVIVHDGVTRINAEELGAVWRAHLAGDDKAAVTIDDLRLPARTQAAMDAVHSRVAGFRLMPGKDGSTDADASPAANRQAAGIGSIPMLPRPNFLGA
ncbi:MAG: glycosyltransferase, partial [Planctomycetota bacterium]